MRVIAHIDMDAFFASIEQQVNPALRGKPVLVGARPGKARTVVAGCSYEAKACGVQSGMSLPEARRLCPHAIFVAADTAKYLSTSDRIFAMLHAYSPQVEAASIDEFYIDWSGAHLQRVVAVAREIKEKIREMFRLTCSIGIAPNKLVAKVAAKLSKPDGLMILLPEEVEGFLHNLPVEKIPGIGPKTTRRLREMGIATCGDLASFPVENLIARFGIWGYHFSRMARGIPCEDPVIFTGKEAPPLSIGHSQTLPPGRPSPEGVRAWLLLLCVRVGRRLRQQGCEARLIRVWYRKTDFRSWSRQRLFGSPTSDERVIYTRACALLEEIGGLVTPGEVRAIGVSVSALSPPEKGEGLFPDSARRKRFLSAVDTIADRLGEAVLRPALTFLVNKNSRTRRKNLPGGRHRWGEWILEKN